MKALSFLMFIILANTFGHADLPPVARFVFYDMEPEKVLIVDNSVIILPFFVQPAIIDTFQ